MAVLDEECTTYYCAVCGPCLRLRLGEDEGDITVHKDVPHPLAMLFDEETLQ